MQINFPNGATGTGAKLFGLAGAMARAPFRGLPRTLSTCWAQLSDKMAANTTIPILDAMVDTRLTSQRRD